MSVTGRWVRRGSQLHVYDVYDADEAAPELFIGPPDRPAMDFPRRFPKFVPGLSDHEAHLGPGDRLGTPPTIGDRRFADAPLDPELVKRARNYRLTKTDLSEESFERNVAVIAYMRNGRIYYQGAANDPRKLHSESVALKKIEKGDPHWLRTKIVGVYSERQPCSNCARDLAGVRTRLRERGGIDFPVHYSVGQWEPRNTRARELRDRWQ